MTRAEWVSARGWYGGEFTSFIGVLYSHYIRFLFDVYLRV